MLPIPPPPPKLTPQEKIWREVYQAFRKIVSVFTKVPVKTYCPICQYGFRQKFAPFRRAANAVCLHCKSNARHRFLWLMVEEQWGHQKNHSRELLHFAPERCFVPHFEKWFGIGYVTGDIKPGRAKHVVDITNICFPDNRFDYIICSHVLEHIIDDMTALKELYRVLKPVGTAYLSVPIRGDTTYEDYGITSPEDRTKHFGQFDHVRYYGEDIIEKIQSVGFSVEVVCPADVIQNGKLRETLGLSVNNKFFIAKKH